MEEFAAERIVGHFRAHRDRKLLIFLHGRHLGSAGGVPYLVAQRIRARQLVLDSETDRSSRSQLMAWSGGYDAWSWDNAWSWHAGGRWSGLGGGWGQGRLKIIDGSPRASGDLL